MQFRVGRPICRIDQVRIINGESRKIHLRILAGLERSQDLLELVQTGSAGQEVIDGGVPAIAASKLVGHSDSKTTERWYYDLTGEQRRAIQERMPS